MKVLFFAGAKDITNQASVELPPILSVPKLVDELVKLYPQLSSILPTCMLAVNLEYVELSGIDANGNQIILNEKDEIALIPPVSGDNQHVPFQKLDENPHVKTVVSFFRPRDYLNVGLFGTGFPAAFYLWVRFWGWQENSREVEMFSKLDASEPRKWSDQQWRLSKAAQSGISPSFTAQNDIITNTTTTKVGNKPKENVPLNFQKVYQILMILIDPAYHPIYVHCLDGAVVTMVTIMCLRKLQGWPVDSYLSEAQRFLKEDELSSEEVEFVTKFNGEFEIPANLVPKLPKWVFAIVNPRKHPTMKLRLGTTQAEPSLMDLNTLRSSFSNTNLLPPSRLPSTSERGSILDDKVYNDPEEGTQTPKRQNTFDSRLEFEQEARVSRTIMAFLFDFGLSREAYLVAADSLFLRVPVFHQIPANATLVKFNINLFFEGQEPKKEDQAKYKERYSIDERGLEEHVNALCNLPHNKDQEFVENDAAIKRNRQALAFLNSAKGIKHTIKCSLSSFTHPAIRDKFPRASLDGAIDGFY
ncbi:hypothetical protein HDV06_004595 [Boothiomyces sp. JEL0866]|nr:hypothetical protein HDV06_004595 [Boothiomyces sp. JEL0866]